MIIQIPEKVNTVLETLKENGHEAYIVGGCVRDSVLGRIPKDWDITTSASPQEVKACFPRTVDTGLQHGTVTVILDGEGYEVTTYRVDGVYEDGRHPKEVHFTRSLEEDLRRRDFTINAMAYAPEKGLVDLFDGMGDIRRGLIRAVGEPVERFSEDALRMLRAVRFSARLNYEIEEKTYEAICRLAPALCRISAERIREELIGILLSDHPEKLSCAAACGLTAVFLPELDRCFETPQNNPHHCWNVGEHILRSVQAARADRILRLTMLFHDIGKPLCRTTDEQGIDHFHGHAEIGTEMTRQILRRLKFDNDTIDQVCRLVRYHDLQPEYTERAMRRAMVKVGPELFPLLLEVKAADLCAQSTCQAEQKQEALREWEALYQKVRESLCALSLKDLAVSGKDLIAEGISPGRQIGSILNTMLEDVLDHPEHNTREYLLTAYVRNENNA
ncbi:MAG: HD domain-containing protein [Lachnospiraceae bacterium]|nr:HD domain-containing protein [Lachnospiraceae bacterium]